MFSWRVYETLQETEESHAFARKLRDAAAVLFVSI